LLQEAGVPAGLVNVVTTNDAGSWFDATIGHRAVRMLSFTGSTEVGRKLLAGASGRVLKTVMELGGNAPLVVFDDADIAAAVEGAMLAKMRHSAETCTAANRFYVEAGVADEFTERFAVAMAEIAVGNGMEAGVGCGPLIEAKALDSVSGLADDAIGEGAKVVTGGARLDRPGYFYEPTVLAGVRHGTKITREEVFGPVAPVISFTDHDEMVDQANDTEMGLAAYVFTRD